MTAPQFFAEEYGVRTVSVLIVDTVDSVATKERLGQENADELYRPVELILRKAISRSGGHTVKGLGDGVLAIFPSASSALRAACSAFQDTATLNQTASEHVSLRAGVSVGDVALERDDIKGLAVDEAARLQAAADHDGVLLSDETYLTARGRTNCVLVPGPELRLKGIEHSVKTWSIDWGASPESIDLEVQLPDKLVTELRSRFPFADRRAAMETLGVPVLGEQPRLTVVRGPSGVGKTRLLAEWLDHARHHGAFVFYSRSERQTSASERELGSALREFRTSLAHARLMASLPGYKRIYEELESTWATSSRESIADTDDGLLIEHLVAFLVHLGRDSPTILVLDNVQYATAATLDLVERILGRFSSSVRVVCVITNDLALDEMTISEERLLSRFPLSERVEILDLEPLDLHGVIEWLELQPMITLRKPAPVPLDDIGLEIAEAFFEASGGNPNVLGLVIRDSYDLERRVSMDDDGHWRAQGDLDSLRRSQSAEKLIQARLARLNSDERELLDIASIAGLEIDGDLVRRVSRRDLDDVNRLLGTAVTRHFISEADGVARFETEATRRVIYRIMSAATRARWHEAIAYSLRERASDGRMLVPDVQIARHFSAVAAMDGRHAPDAANHFLRAARRALRTEPGDAVSLAHEALAVVDKFELVDDGQLRAEADDIVAAAQRELSYAESQVAPGSADELDAIRRGTHARR